MAVDLNRLYHININVADLQRSIDFYEKLGFRVVARFKMEGDLGEKTAKAFGAQFNPIEAAFLKLGDRPGAMLIDLCQYCDPPTAGMPIRQLNHAGMVRLAFHVDNIEEVHRSILDMGIETLGPLEFMTPPGGTRSGVFAFYDPDGTILEVLTGVEHMAG